ncbi:25227_t:CDS:2, partial [Gigaspora rosea]
YGLKGQTFRLASSSYWKSLRHGEAECIELLVEFHKFIQDLTIKMVSIVPSQTACEPNFSILKWVYGDQRNRLSIKHIEYMAKLRIENLTEEELRAWANMATILVELSS